MGNPGQADKLDQSAVSENQDRTFDISFGIFFDVHEVKGWMTAVGNYRKKGEKWKNDLENDVRDSQYYKIAQIVEGTAGNIVEKLPNNPVSKAIKTGLEAKDKLLGYKDAAEDAVGKLSGFIDDKSNKILDNDIVKLEGVDPLGSKQSIISQMEPVYQGKMQELKGMDEILATYCHRIYAQGGILAFDFQEKKSDNNDDELSESEKAENEENIKQWKVEVAKKAADDVFEDIKRKLSAAPQGKISVHFDLFGYANDDSMSYLEPKLNNLKSLYPSINELNVDYKGQYNKFNDPDEVQGSLGETRVRFRNTKFLEK